ncbi:MAG: phosphoribosyl-ATP diphosphatase [Salaquimonas sp.]|jgi:phosphoribosyl-ATP pyrophosphohydrolase|nr:phosphoribosyl-ATP diphosphatase [Salaquimonas sp.]
MFTLTDLENIIAERANATDGSSYTASLVADGPARCARKMGEEAVETIVAVLDGDESELTAEAADLLYHLLVALKVRGVMLADVMAELERRTARSGLAEKAARNSTGR